MKESLKKAVARYGREYRKENLEARLEYERNYRLINRQKLNNYQKERYRARTGYYENRNKIQIEAESSNKGN